MRFPKWIRVVACAILVIVALVDVMILCNL